MARPAWSGGVHPCCGGMKSNWVVSLEPCAVCGGSVVMAPMSQSPFPSLFPCLFDGNQGIPPGIWPDPWTEFRGGPNRGRPGTGGTPRESASEQVRKHGPLILLATVLATLWCCDLPPCRSDSPARNLGRASHGGRTSWPRSCLLLPVSSMGRIDEGRVPALRAVGAYDAVELLVPVASLAVL